MQILKLTKELKDKGVEVTNKDIVSFLNSEGIEVANHMSAIEDDAIARVRAKFDPSEERKKPAKTAAPPAPEKEGTEKKAAVRPQTPTEGRAPAAPVKRPVQGSAGGPKPVKKKKPNIIFSTNTANSRSNMQGGGRQIVHITNGQIEQPRARRPFKHVEVTTPESFARPKEEPEKKPAAPETPPVKEKPEAAPAPAPKAAETPKETPPAPAKAPVKEKTEKPAEAGNAAKGGAEAKTAGQKIYGNVYSSSYAAPRRSTDAGAPRNGGVSGARQTRQGANVAPGSAGRSGNVAYGSGRPYSGGANHPGSVRGNQRPGSRGSGAPGRGGFDAPAKAPGSDRSRPDAGRRRQNDERKKKDQNFEKSREEKNVKKFNPHGFHKPVAVEKKPEEEIKVITIPDSLTIRELADHMKIQPSGIIKKLFLSGQVVTLNSEITYEEAENIAIDYDIICEHAQTVDVIAELLSEEEEDEKDMVMRPPVVCVMGHVDHGKTSLLDQIRKSHVTDRESGGITQAIGAYVVKSGERKITFLDTPGHEAFTAMRMRGANATDIAILVVAADDGVMPQTIEAINHAKAANVEIIVAVNKIDKPNANIDRVKQELAEYELIPEDWGGSTVYVPVSAKTGEGIDQLLEMILLTADVLELKANPNRQARGMVIESRLEKGRGTVATLLVQKGTLHVGDFIAVGPCHGKVRAMLDENGRQIKEALPSTPAEILGLNEVPDAGEVFVSPLTDKEARNFAATYVEQHKKELLNETRQKMSLDDLYSKIQEGNLKEFNIVVKADVQGSVEAMTQSLEKLSNDEVVVKIIHGGVGAINESDVILASASNAIIIGFNVRPDTMAKQSAESEDVDIRLYKVIYQAIDDVEAAMKGLLAPVFEEKIIGHAEIRQIFKASGIGNISGSYVTDGVVERGCSVRISRAGEQIFEGKLASLKRFKDDVKEVREGYECGLVFEGFDAVEELDTIEFFKMVEVERE